MVSYDIETFNIYAAAQEEEEEEEEEEAAYINQGIDALR